MICLTRDILYMRKTRIQIKNMNQGGKKMKKIFTKNWYLQKIYFSPISEKDYALQKTMTTTDV